MFATLSRRRKVAIVILAIICVLVIAAIIFVFHLLQLNASPFVKADASTIASGIASSSTSDKAPTAFADTTDSTSNKTSGDTLSGSSTNSTPSYHLYNIDYCSEIVAGNDPTIPSGKTSTNMFFEDAWFSSNPNTYNHDLACASIVLSAVVNSESQYYGDVKGNEAYAEVALEQLGFQDIDTSSFTNASKTIDELTNFAAGNADTVAFTFAHKTLPATEGDKTAYTLVFVGVRGTFGSEWISNFRLADSNWVGTSTDHAGFHLAEVGVEAALYDYLKAHNLDANNTKLLVCGHSRGGSVANLLARSLIDSASTNNAVVKPENLFAYTFAASANTRNSTASDKRYQNIYNVVNPTDLVPRVPLAAWNYQCYGTMVHFPGLSDNNFNAAFDTMQNVRAANTGFISTRPYRYGETCPAEQVVDAIAQQVPTADSLYSVVGVAQTANVLVQHDLYRILISHFPDTYIAWLQSLDPQDLIFEGASTDGKGTDAVANVNADTPESADTGTDVGTDVDATSDTDASASARTGTDAGTDTNTEHTTL